MRYTLDIHTPYREELKDKILKVAMQMFKTQGIRAVRMDDIAETLSISKRTLYELYGNKEDLLMAGVRSENEEMDKKLTSYFQDTSLTAMDVVIAVYKERLASVEGVNPIFFMDLHRYGRIIDYFRKKNLQDRVPLKEFLLRGVNEGYFLPHVDYDLMLELGHVIVQHVMERQLYRHYSYEHISRNITLLQMRSFCAPKGIEIIDKLLFENLEQLQS